MAQTIGDQKKIIDNVSPLNLAFIGDSVYETVIRTKVLLENNTNLKDINIRAGRYTNARAQSEMILLVENDLTEMELGVFKRGRNAKSVSAPKSSTIGEYRNATGFESLIGFLYLSGEMERIHEIVDSAVSLFNKE